VAASSSDAGASTIEEDGEVSVTAGGTFLRERVCAKSWLVKPAASNARSEKIRVL
jgi:hypothetical protein